METEVALLKQRADQTEKRLESIDGKLDGLIQSVAELPTRRDLSSWKVQWTALSVGTIAIVVGGIIGGLSWIKPDSPPAAQTAPTVINVQPAPVTVIPSPAAPAAPAPPAAVAAPPAAAQPPKRN